MPAGGPSLSARLFAPGRGRRGIALLGALGFVATGIALGVAIAAPIAPDAELLAGQARTLHPAVLVLGVLFIVKFAVAWGCEVTAFTSSESKLDEAKRLGAHYVGSSTASEAIGKLGGSVDLLISTVNVPLDWDAMIGTLAPNGRLHVVGAVLDPIPVSVFALLLQERSVSASPAGSPAALRTMLDFAARHDIAPQTEHYPMSAINEAFGRLESGKVRYRIVLDADF